ncbi:hypothetical protein HK102_013438 [Quaeritorhiza haematococci]|nr:hypothetical protein HK102_013438 [Quaeritorhiza haematococci]
MVPEMQECRCVLKFSVGKSIGYPLLTSTFAALMTVDLSYAYLALSNVSSTGAAEGGLFQKLQTPSLLFKAFFPFILAFDDMIQKLVRAPSPCEQLLLENAAAAAAEAATQQEKQGAKFNNYGTGIPKISIEGPSAEALRKNPSWYLDANQKQKLNVSGVYQEFTQAWGNQDPNGPPNGNPNISPEAAMQALYANAAYNNDQNVPPAFNEALGIVVEDKNRTLRVPGTHPSGTVPSLQRRGISVCSGGESAGGTMSRALDSHLFTISRYSENYDPLKRRVSGLHPGSFRSSFNSEMPMSPGIVSPRTPRSPGA